MQSVFQRADWRYLGVPQVMEYHRPSKPVFANAFEGNIIQLAFPFDLATIGDVTTGGNQWSVTG